MSEQNLLNYNIFKSSTENSNELPFTYGYPLENAYSDQRKVAMVNQNNSYQPTFDHHSYFLPPINTSSLAPTTTPSSLTFTSIIQHQKILDPKQWDTNDVSQSAILINEENQMAHHGDHLSIGSQQSDDQAPTHIVSPEAIREALIQEKEEAMGHSQRRPFSKFTSFHALKQRRYSSEYKSPSPPPASLSIPFSPPPSIESNPLQHQDDDQDSRNDDEFYMDTIIPIEEDTKQSPKEKLKRPPNAYLLFNRDMRRKLLKSSPKMTVAEISKEVGDWWKALSKDKRDYYVKEASILKEEHLKKYPDFIYTRRSKAQLAEAKKLSKLGRKAKSSSNVLENETGTSQSNDLIVINSHPTKRTRKAASAGGQRDPRGRKKKRHKHPFAPKHPMSAYLYYLASVYPQVSLNFPGSTVGPISKSISKTWHAMSPEERLPWKQKADSDKARYASEMQVYMANNNLQEEQKKIQQQQQLQQQQRRQQQVLSDDEISPKNYDEGDEEVDEEDVEDVDVNTLAAVVNMVNNNSSSNNGNHFVS